jgi:hypothetical protein
VFALGIQLPNPPDIASRRGRKAVEKTLLESVRPKKMDLVFSQVLRGEGDTYTD